MGQKPRRRSYVVDPGLQLPIALHTVGVMVGIAILYAIALFILPGEGSLEELDAERTRDVFVRANIIYFGLATTILFTVTMLLTHRVAGPARVIEEAVRDWARGDLDHRLTLRKRDYLKNVAAAVSELRDSIHEREDARQRRLEELDARLREGDVEGAREIVRTLVPDAPEPTAV